MEGEIILLILQVCLMCDSSTACLLSVSTTEELPFCQSRISKHITPDLRGREGGRVGGGDSMCGLAFLLRG